jgi:hypothetical protein
MQQRTQDGTWLAEVFTEHRAHLRAVAYRMLGSLPDADDAVQDAWVRFSQSDAGRVDNLGGFLTTIVARVCLNKLRARKARPEDPVGVHVPDPILSSEDGGDPETEALLADSVAGQRGRRRGPQPRRPAGRPDGVHHRGGADHRDRRHHRPRPPQRARPARSRRLARRKGPPR